MAVFQKWGTKRTLQASAMDAESFSSEIPPTLTISG